MPFFFVAWFLVDMEITVMVHTLLFKTNNRLKTIVLMGSFVYYVLARRDKVIVKYKKKNKM